MPDPILSIRDLTVEFKTEDGIVQAVTDVSYDLHAGRGARHRRRVGLGQERLDALDPRALRRRARIPKGEAIFKGQDLLKLSQKQLREIRGGDMAMIFQDPMTSLNPVLTVGNQISEALLVAQPGMSDDAAKKRADRAARGRGRPVRRAPRSTSTRTSSRAACASAR